MCQSEKSSSILDCLGQIDLVCFLALPPPSCVISANVTSAASQTVETVIVLTWWRRVQGK